MSDAATTVINASELGWFKYSNSPYTGTPAWDDFRVQGAADSTNIYSSVTDYDGAIHAAVTGKAARTSGTYLKQTRFLATFDCTAIKSTGITPSAATLTVGLRRGTNTNIDGEHAWIAVLANSSVLENNDEIVDHVNTFGSINIAGVGTSQDSWDNLVTKFSTGGDRFGAMSTAADNEIDCVVPAAGLEAIRENDYIGIWIIDYNYVVLDQDPAPAAPSAGAETTAGWNKSTGNWKLTVTSGGVVDDDSLSRKRIMDDDFQLNTFRTEGERKRYTKNGKVLDQIPYILGVKGPTSLRGRENDSDGTPLTTASPPKVTSGGKD